MLPTEDFKRDIVAVVYERLKANPNSLADAFCVIWAVDAYAAHVAAVECFDEIEFKNKIQNEGGWQFRLLREASNSLKHAVVRKLLATVASSDKVTTSPNIIGWAAWVSASPHVGEQICIHTNWTRDAETKQWIDGEGAKIIGLGPFFKTVPILSLVAPALVSIDATRNQLLSI